MNNCLDSSEKVGDLWQFHCAICGQDKLCNRPRWCHECPAPSRGLGDTVTNVLGWFGIKDSGCGGCGGRRQRLNDWFPYRKQ